MNKSDANMPKTVLKVIIAIALCAIILALILPVLRISNDRHKIYCTSNLKQIGLAFRVWEGDHQDRFPFNVPANEGGTLELCDRDTNGFDRSSWRHFLVMSNELYHAKLMVCPSDKSKTTAPDWQKFGPANLTYLIRSGTNIDDSKTNEILVLCPVCGAKCYVDAHVESGPKN